jgi:hypothetical protein
MQATSTRLTLRPSRRQQSRRAEPRPRGRPVLIPTRSFLSLPFPNQHLWQAPVFRVKKALVEYTLYFSGGLPVLIQPPSAPTTPDWLVLGLPLADVSLTTATVALPFSTLTSISSLSDSLLYTQIYREYQIDGMEMAFTLLTDPANSLSLAAQVPELLILYDSTTNIPPPLVSTCEGYPDLRRKFLNIGQPAQYSCTPSFPINIGPAAFPGTAVAASPKPMWLDSDFPTVSHYGLQGVIRNFSTASFLAIRITGSVFLSLRRPN